MRKLKELYQIAQQYHQYWNPRDTTKYMCYAVDAAWEKAAISNDERLRLRVDIMEVVRSLKPSALSLMYALNTTSNEEVKAYWETYINELED